MSKAEPIRETRDDKAASWMWRLDRSLTADEQDAFFDWLAETPENSEKLNQCRRNWSRLDNLANWLPEHSEKPNPDLLAPRPRPKILKWISFSLATAAVLIFSVLLWQSYEKRDSKAYASTHAVESDKRISMEDGSVVKLKDDAKVTILYTPEERRVRLDKGEAFFIVAKNPLRPFVVEVERVEVSALGTAFNVRLDARSFEVLVSEGVVKVDSAGTHYDEIKEEKASKAPVLEANQRAVISLEQDRESPEIATLTVGERHRVLAWQHGLMTFNYKPLSEIAYELNHFNETQMIVTDEKLASTQFSGSFRSDNMEGFVRLLEVAFGAKADWNGPFEIHLSKKVD